MTIVVDASVAIKWVALDEDREPARQLLLGNGPILAPQLLMVEAANTLRMKVVRKQLSEEQARSGLLFIASAVSRFVLDGELASRALDLAFALNHPAYDCFYLACAERENAEMFTADARLIQKLGGNPQWTRVRALL